MCMVFNPKCRSKIVAQKFPNNEPLQFVQEFKYLWHITGSCFYWSISGTFVGGYGPSPNKKKSVLRFCVPVLICLCPFMLNISLIFYINDFADADTGTSLLYW